MAAGSNFTLLELFLHESELVEVIFPRQRVIAGMRVCTHLRRALLRACESKSSRLQVDLRIRCCPVGKNVFGRDDWVGFERFRNACVHLAINPTPKSPVSVAVFSELHRTIRGGDCFGPVSLDLSSCYWNWDMTGSGRYGHQLDEPNSSTVIMQREEEEEEVFQAINYSSKRLRTLIWTNCMPFCEAIDMRPLVLALGVSLTHLDLSGHRLDIASNRRAFVDKLPMMQSLVRLFLRHTRVCFETDREGGPSEHLAETEILSDSEGMWSPVCLLKAIAYCLELQELDLSGNRLGSRGTLLLAHFMPALPMLKTLSLRGASLDDTCAPALGKLLYKCSLQKLEVAHNDFTYFGCGVLKRASENVIFEADLKWIREVGIRDWNLLRNYADPCWTGDKVLILELLEWWWEALEISSPTLQDDPDLFAACLRHHDSVGWRALRLAGESIRSNKSSVAEACAMDIRAIEYASQNVKDDKDFIMKLVREDEHGMVLRHMGSRMKSDRDVVLAAVQKCGSSLQFASDELRGDMAIVLAAIRSSFHALAFASDELKNDSKVKIEAGYWKTFGNQKMCAGPNWGNN